jgi:lipopolysaccharide export system protein LptA
MKKLLFVFLLAVTFTACSQNNDKRGTETLKSKFVRLIEDTTKMMLIENVVIKYGDLYAEADSVLLEKPKQTVTIFGASKATFKGAALSEKEKNGIIRYRKGDAKFYIN